MKIKKLLIDIIVILAILISFGIPDFLLKIVENTIESEVYVKGDSETLIDIETEKIYLVKAIHDIESDNTQVEISNTEKSWILVESSSEVEGEISVESAPNNAKEQLQKLKDYNILNQFNIDENEKYNINLIKKTYKSKDSYVINNVYLNTPNELYNIEMEEKTGKIVFINFSKDDLYKECSQEELLINYVKYLDLYIIDDWRYENNMLKSEKAGLVASLLENSTRYMLAIHSIEKNSNNIIYVYHN